MASYFGMLRAELAEQPFVKARINREVQALTGRSRGSVERKFQNISAILLSMGAVFVDGYKPLGNVQQALREGVINRWMAEPDIEDLMLAQALLQVSPPPLDLIWTVSRPPTYSADSSVMEGRARIPMRLDFVKLEADRRDLGRAGEEAVVRFERDRLITQGRQRLARRVEQVSLTRGDGLGYDVLSFDDQGDELFIEVKTTRRPREFPFLITRNEVALSAEVPDRVPAVPRVRLQQAQDGAVHVGRIAGVLLPADPDHVAGSASLSVSHGTTPSGRPPGARSLHITAPP